MAIDFKTFNTVVDFVLADKKPVLIRGRHGIGKSQVVYQTAKRMGLPVVERRASQMTEGDLMGLPSNPPSGMLLIGSRLLVIKRLSCFLMKLTVLQWKSDRASLS